MCLRYLGFILLVWFPGVLHAGETGHGGATVGATDGGHTTSAGAGTLPIATLSHCGRPPIVPNSEVVETGEMFLTYQCGIFYKRVGPEIVKCYSDGTWSEVPTCKATFCSVNTDEHPYLERAGIQFIKDGETVELECQDRYWFDNYSVVKCTNGIETISRCCNKLQISTGVC